MKRGHLAAYLWTSGRKVHGHLAARCREQAAAGLPATVGGRAVLDVLNDDRML
jgi:hypothetical protein